MEKNTQTPEDKLHYYSSAIRRDMGNLLKWLILAAIVGYVAGAFSTLFSFVLKAVTSYRKANQWIFYLLPLSGLCIVFLYDKLGKDDGAPPGAFHGAFPGRCALAFRTADLCFHCTDPSDRRFRRT